MYIVKSDWLQYRGRLIMIPVYNTAAIEWTNSSPSKCLIYNMNTVVISIVLYYFVPSVVRERSAG